MSCWRKTVVLRIPALALGFVYRWEWYEFVKIHKKDFGWDPSGFSVAFCTDYKPGEYNRWFPKNKEEWLASRLDLNVYPDIVKSVPGPFLDYWIEEIAPLTSENRKYNMEDIARPLTPEEKEKYLPLYQKLLPHFTLENMNDVHYCSYEWYDGAEPPYFY